MKTIRSRIYNRGIRNTIYYHVVGVFAVTAVSVCKLVINLVSSRIGNQRVKVPNRIHIRKRPELTTWVKSCRKSFYTGVQTERPGIGNRRTWYRVNSYCCRICIRTAIPIGKAVEYLVTSCSRNRWIKSSCGV